MKREDRPADVVGNAVHVCKIAIGEIEENQAEAVKSAPNRAKGGRVGGQKRVKALTAKRRSEIAKAAAEARWAL